MEWASAKVSHLARACAPSRSPRWTAPTRSSSPTCPSRTPATGPHRGPRRGRVVPRRAPGARPVPVGAEPPYVPGVEAAGVVRAAPPRAAGLRARGSRRGDDAGRRLGGGGHRRAGRSRSRCPTCSTSPQGAGLVLNYHTGLFALVTRGRLREGETVLVHGAAGGVGTATLQVARGLGARTIAVVSSDEKERVAREAGADEVVRSDGAWRDEVRGAHRRRRRPRRSTRSAATASPTASASLRDRATARRRRLHRRLDPRGPGQPAAAAQHRGRRRGLGRVDGRSTPRTGGRSARRSTASRTRASCGPSSARASPSRTARRRCGSSRVAERVGQGRARRRALTPADGRPVRSNRGSAPSPNRSMKRACASLPPRPSRSRTRP